MKIIKVSKLIPNIRKYLDVSSENFPGENKQKKNNINNDFFYEIMLLEAIVDYKYKKLILESKILKNDNNYFLFYTDLIDLFLFEKIFSQIELNEKIKKFCKIWFNLVYYDRSTDPKTEENGEVGLSHFKSKPYKTVKTSIQVEKLLNILLREKLDFVKLMSRTNE